MDKEKANEYKIEMDKLISNVQNDVNNLVNFMIKTMPKKPTTILIGNDETSITIKIKKSKVV